MCNCSINSNTQKKTLKAIVRALWPVGPVHSAGKPRSAFFDDTFYSNVLDRFEVTCIVHHNINICEYKIHTCYINYYFY